MRSGGGVLTIAAAQLLVGMCLLGVYEGYKASYLKGQLRERKIPTSVDSDTPVVVYERNAMFRTPMDYVFYASILSNVFSVLGAAGIVHSQRDLVMAFFTYNAIQMVVIFHYFVDLCADIGIPGQSQSEGSYEQAAAAFLFFNFCLSISAALYGMRAVDEMKVKQREEFTRLAVLSDTLQFDADV